MARKNNSNVRPSSFKEFRNRDYIRFRKNRNKKNTNYKYENVHYYVNNRNNIYKRHNNYLFGEDNRIKRYKNDRFNRDTRRGHIKGIKHEPRGGVDRRVYSGEYVNSKFVHGKFMELPEHIQTLIKPSRNHIMPPLHTNRTSEREVRQPITKGTNEQGNNTRHWEQIREYRPSSNVNRQDSSKIVENNSEPKTSAPQVIAMVTNPNHEPGNETWYEQSHINSEMTGGPGASTGEVGPEVRYNHNRYKYIRKPDQRIAYVLEAARRTYGGGDIVDLEEEAVTQEVPEEIENVPHFFSTENRVHKTGNNTCETTGVIEEATVTRRSTGAIPKTNRPNKGKRKKETTDTHLEGGRESPVFLNIVEDSGEINKLNRRVPEGESLYRSKVPEVESTVMCIQRLKELRDSCTANKEMTSSQEEGYIMAINKQGTQEQAQEFQGVQARKGSTGVREIGRGEEASPLDAIENCEQQNSVQPNKRELGIPYIKELKTNMFYILDTGSRYSILRAKATGRAQRKRGALTAANGTQVPVYESEVLQLNLGTGRVYNHEFLVADVVVNILGTDFLTKHGFVVDLKENILKDTNTGEIARLKFKEKKEVEEVLSLKDFIVTPNLPEHEGEFRKVLTKYSHIFVDQKLANISHNMTLPSEVMNEGMSSRFNLRPEEVQAISEMMPYRFKVKEEQYPINIKARRIPYIYMDAVKNEIRYLLETRVIEPASSAWGFPITVVPKQNGKIRIVADLRLLNQRVVRDNYQLPNIDDFKNQLTDCKYFSTLDITKAFYTLRIDPACKKFLTINTPIGSFSYTRVLEGLCVSPTSYMRYITLILSRVPNIFIYVDDILLATKTIEEHMDIIELILYRLQLYNIQLNPEKCQVGQREVKYLGFILKENSYKPNEDRVEAIAKIPRPKTIKQIRSFVGSLTYFRGSIPGLAEILNPLYQYLRGRPGSRTKVIWSEEAEKAFQNAKEALIGAIPLTFPSREDQVMIYTDASNHTLSGVVLAERRGARRPLGFFSYTLKRSELLYTIFSKELLALVKMFKKYSHLMWGREVKVHCDNLSVVQALKKTTDSSVLHAREQRYLAYLSEFEVNLVHIKSTDNILADFLSRIVPVKQKEGPEIAKDEKSTHNNRSECIGRKEEEGRDELYETRSRVEEDITPNSGISDKPKETSELCALTVAQYWKSKQNPVNYKAISEAMETDQYLIDVLANEVKSNMKLSKKSFRIDGEDIPLYVDSSYPKGERIYVPECEQKLVIAAIHNQSHMGVQRTLTQIRKAFVWKNMHKSIKEYIKTCDACQRAKASRQTKPQYQRYAPVHQKFEVVHLDLLKMPGCKGYGYLLTIIDRYSRFLYAYPLRNIDARSVAEVITTHFLPLSGMVKTFVTDRGGQFTGDLFNAVMQELGIKHKTTSPYAPFANGIVENAHKTLLNSLRACLLEAKGNGQQLWLNILPFVLMCLRAAPLNEEGITPYLLMYGQEPRIPGAILEHNSKDIALSLQHYTQQLKTLMSLPLSPEFTAMNPHVYVPRTLEEAKHVVVRDNQFGKCKLAPIYLGPYKIERIRGNTVMVWKGDKLMPENLANVKPYFSLNIQED